MPTNLPVPSKGALRALRNLALGTSCTVAVGAGLLTEDRRRRIHTARQVYDNAQTLKSLKSSRHYHSAGVLEQFEEHALGPSEDAFWLPSNVAKSKSLAIPRSPTKEEKSRVKPAVKLVKKPSIPVPPTRSVGATRPRTHVGSASCLKDSNTFIVPHARSQDLQERKDSDGDDTLKGIFVRQQQLASEVKRLLEVDSPSNVELATSRFLDAFSDGMKVTKNGMTPDLVDAAIRLFHAAPTGSKTQEQILLVVSRHGPIEEAKFHQMSPTHIMNRMMSRVRGANNHVYKELFEDVVAIYRTPFLLKPSITTGQLQNLGEKLCATACELGLYDLTQKLFARIELLRGDRPVRCVRQLIEAVHAGRQPQKNFRHFKMLYTQTSPDQLEFFKIGTMVLDTLLKKDPSKSEDFLDLALKMAESNEIQMSTSWFLRVLGQHWRTNQDIASTRILFERMVPQISHTSHPQAVYSAMIQFCIEAGLEAEASEYYARLCQVYPGSSKDSRTLGHFAYGKAVRQDWDGVGKDLRTIHDSNPERNAIEQQDFSAIFTPILQKYCQSHSITETETYIRRAVNKWQLKITPSISNIMVGIYTESKEVNSLLRWMELSTSVGCAVDAGTINALLKKLAADPNFAFLEIYRIYQRFCESDVKLGTKCTNTETTLLLRQIAVSTSRNDHEARQNLGRLGLSSSETYGPHFEFGSGRIHWNMLRAYLNEHLENVLSIYSAAQAGPVKIGPKHLLLAVKATLKLNANGLTEAAALIKSAQDDGLTVADSVSQLMVYRIEKLDANQADAQDIADMVRDDIKALKLRGINVPDTVLTHAMSVLVRRGRFRRAIDVWHSLSHTTRNSEVPDLVTLTVLLEAYIGIQFNGGIRWVCQSLVDNKRFPDSKFLSVLNNERRRVHVSMARGVYSNKVKNYATCIDNACVQAQKIRSAVQEEKTEVKYKILQIVEKSRLMAHGSGGRVKIVGKSVVAPVEDMEVQKASVGGNGTEELDLEDQEQELTWTPLPLAVAAGSG